MAQGSGAGTEELNMERAKSTEVAVLESLTCQLVGLECRHRTINLLQGYCRLEVNFQSYSQLRHVFSHSVEKSRSS